MLAGMRWALVWCLNLGATALSSCRGSQLFRGSCSPDAVGGGALPARDSIACRMMASASDSTSPNSSSSMAMPS